MTTDTMKTASWSPERGLHRTVRNVAAGIAALRALQRAARERAELLQMSERDLHDIGVSRLDAVQAARRPLWRWL